MDISIQLTAVLLALSMSGCRSNVPAPAERLRQAVDSPITYDLVAPERVRQGARVPLKIVAHNLSTAPVQLATVARPFAFDLVITGPDGTEVWSRIGRNKAVDLTGQINVIGPGEILEFTHVWDQRGYDGRMVPLGTYRVRGIVLSTPAANTESKLLVVTSGVEVNAPIT